MDLGIICVCKHGYICIPVFLVFGDVVIDSEDERQIDYYYLDVGLRVGSLRVEVLDSQTSSEDRFQNLRNELRPVVA